MPPAARITDMHVCPAVTVLVPHVGGPIIPPCAPTVLTGFLPQARVTDLLTCVGPPDVIQQGSATVVVVQMPAARITDPTVHGGVIVTGCPTVIIGGPAAAAVMRGNTTVIVDRVNQTITLVGTQEFSGTGASQDYADRASQMINSTWSGPTQFEGKNYQVTAMISRSCSEPRDPPMPGTNQIDVVQTAQPFAVTSQQDPSKSILRGVSGSPAQHGHGRNSADGRTPNLATRWGCRTSTPKARAKCRWDAKPRSHRAAERPDGVYQSRGAADARQLQQPGNRQWPGPALIRFFPADARGLPQIFGIYGWPGMAADFTLRCRGAACDPECDC